MVPRQFWSNWVYDSSQTPIEWKTHPHRAFKIIARLAGVFLGSIAPCCLILLHSGILSRLDEGTVQVGWVFWGTVVGFVAAWLVWVGIAAASEEKTLMKYVFIGSVVPANLTVFFLWIQGIE